MRSMRRPSRIRGLVALLALAGSTACTPLDDAMVAIFGRSMRDQSSFDPYENPLPPADGSVSFASGNFPPGPGQLNTGQHEAMTYDVPPFTQAAMIPPGADVVRELENPVPADSASLARGQVLFDRYCMVCHGPEGIGGGALILDRWAALQVYDLAGPTVQGYTDGYIYGMMRVGRGLMPSYGHQISHFDRWNIVNYVRRLQADYNASQGAQGAQEAAGEPGADAGGEG